MFACKKAQQNILSKRIIALLLTFLLTLQCVALPGTPRANAATTAFGNGVIKMDAANVSHNEKLVDNGDGTYTFQMNMFVSSMQQDQNQNATVARNNYFTASHDGNYLVEIWGGDGASGDNTSYSDGGSGGKGGYVYGVVSLLKGETLFYTLGGNGAKTESTNAGGGVNGDGGAHGDYGSVGIGGGGGYSAVFKFAEADNFEATYLDENGNIAVESILEADRLSKFVMIAGGGGGGGAGNGWSFEGTSTGTPDGGAGGNVLAADGSMAVPDGTVSGGYFFSGKDGKSSGTSVDFVGHGGTGSPGEISDTISDLGWFAGKQPNDWTGTANPNYAGGAGGAGNFRGGAGGGGYAGGSGGVQTSLLYPTNVGGGGGGSSYIAKDVADYTDDFIDIIATSRKGTKPETATTGGAVVITCLGAHGEDVSQMTSFSVSGSVSPYFEIIPDKSSASGGDLSYDGSGFTVKGDIHSANGYNITLTLKPYDTFAGGNNVPLLTNFTYSNGTVTGESFDVDNDCTHANVPLNFHAVGNVYSSTEEKFTVEVSSMYKNNYASATPGIGDYAYIDTISNYAVYRQGDAEAIAETTVTVDETTRYTVSFQVTPVFYDDYVSVGTPITETQEFSATAVLIVSGTTSDPIGNGTNIEYTKQLLSNGDGTYTLSMHVMGTGAKATYEVGERDVLADMPNPTNTTVVYNGSTGSYLQSATLGEFGVDNSSQYTFTAPEEGYYLVQLWAANGGNYTVTLGSLWGEDSTTGGDGGYVYGYLKLEKNQTISVIVGANGNNGSMLGGSSSGKPSFIATTDDSVLMIARGGDGAARNEDGVDSVISGVGDPNNADGASPVNYVGQSSKNLNTNYRAAAMYADVSTLSELNDQQRSDISTALTNAASNTRSNTDLVGEAKITCLAVTGMRKEAFSTENTAIENAAKAFETAFAINAEISQYFTLTGIRGSDANAEGNVLSFANNSNDRTISLSDIQPAVNTHKVEAELAYQSTIDFTVDILLEPKEGFLGGNQVPVLKETTQDETIVSSQIILSQGEYPLSIQRDVIADYANVPIAATNASGLTLSSPTYVLGEDAINIASLVDWENTQDPETATPEDTSDDWIDDYVTFTAPQYEPEAMAPSIDNNTYRVSVGIEPDYTGSDVTAMVVPEVSGTSTAKTASINLVNQIRYNLENMETTHISETVEGYEGQMFYLHPLNLNYNTILQPAAGYILDDSIDLIREDGVVLTAGTDYVYYSDTGELQVYATAINNQPITIIAEGHVQTYSVNFISAELPSLTKTFSYVSGTPLAGTEVDQYINFQGAFADLRPAEREGYTFIWEWDGSDGVMPDRMPANNQWVIGSYVANPYTLTVHYQYENGTEAAPDAVQTVRYGETYSIHSPIIDGYMPSEAEVSGKMGAGDQKIVVTYKGTDNQLVIVYVFTDGSKATETVSKTVSTGEAYAEDFAQMIAANPGYTLYDAEIGGVEVTPISGTMPNGGLVKYVYFRPNTYQVSFLSNGGTEYDPITVQYNMPYGYHSTDDGQTFAYGALPNPLKPGFKFLGWFTENDTQIKETDVVNISEDLQLHAQWEMITYKVTVRYIFPNGAVAGEVVSNVQALTTYEIADPEAFALDNGLTFDGKQPDDGFLYDPGEDISVTVDSNKIILISCKHGPHTLTINYLDADGNKMTGEGFETNPVIIRDLYAYESYQVLSPKLENHAITHEVVEGEMVYEDVTVNVIYRNHDDAQNTLVEVTVDWGNLNFLYDYGTWNPEKHIYENATIVPEGQNTVTITSNKDVSNIYVLPEITYIPRKNNPYPDMTAFFTKTNDQSADAYNSISYDPLAPGGEYVTWIWLKGTMPYNLLGQTISLGSCHVTIRAGSNYETN